MLQISEFQWYTGVLPIPRALGNASLILKLTNFFKLVKEFEMLGNTLEFHKYEENI